MGSDVTPGQLIPQGETAGPFPLNGRRRTSWTAPLVSDGGRSYGRNLPNITILPTISPSAIKPSRISVAQINIYI